MKMIKYLISAAAALTLLMLSAGAEASGFIFKYSDDAPQPPVFDFEAEYFDMNIYFTDDEAGILRLAEKGYIDYYERDAEVSLPDDPVPEVSPAALPNDGIRAEHQMNYEFKLTNALGILNNNIAVGDSPSLRGQGVRVGVIDTGIGQNHPDINYEKVTQYDVFTRKAVANDTKGHGTAVAGVIAAVTDNEIGLASLAPEAELVVVKVYQDGVQTTSTSNILKGIQYAVAEGCDVINISSGMGEINDTGFRSMGEYIDKISEEYGIIVIASAGNHDEKRDPDPYPSDSELSYPAAWENVISVAAIDDSGNRAWFSYHNMEVDTTACGLNVQVLTRTGGYGTNSGTSFSAPFISSVAALVKQIDRSVDVNRFRTLLELTSVDVGQKGKDASFGYGIVDVGAMIDYLLDAANSISVGEIQQSDSEFSVTVVNSANEPVELIDSWSSDFNGQASSESRTVTVQPGENVLTYSGMGDIRHFVWLKESIRPLCPVQTAKYYPEEM